MKPCTLCNQLIKNDESVVALLAGRYVALTEGKYELQVTRHTILSHMVCPPPPASVPVVDAEIISPKAAENAENTEPKA